MSWPVNDWEFEHFCSRNYNTPIFPPPSHFFLLLSVYGTLPLNITWERELRTHVERKKDANKRRNNFYENVAKKHLFWTKTNEKQNLNLNKNETETKTSQEGWKVLTQMIIKQIWQTKFLKNEWPSVASKEWIYNCQIG